MKKSSQVSLQLFMENTPIQMTEKGGERRSPMKTIYLSCSSLNQHHCSTISITLLHYPFIELKISSKLVSQHPDTNPKIIIGIEHLQWQKEWRLDPGTAHAATTAATYPNTITIGLSNTSKRNPAKTLSKRHFE
jgi:hypothetical protein